MRYLTVVASPSILAQLEKCLGSGRMRSLRPGESRENLGVERFAGVIADHTATAEAVRHGLPVILVTGLNRPGLQQFRILVESGADVRLWIDGREMSELSLRATSGQRAPSPAAQIVATLRGQVSGLAADIVTAAAILSDERRSMEEIAMACDTTPTSVRQALRDEGLVPVSVMIARMRCLHALWASEGGRTNFWSAAGFRTLAEVSEYLSRHTGAALGRWRAPGGFATLLAAIGSTLRDQQVRVEARG